MGIADELDKERLESLRKELYEAEHEKDEVKIESLKNQIYEIKRFYKEPNGRGLY
jgi:KaiC/GvpD/RAD55 family RecA-like ATPase